jgi:L-lactate dehydrogenase complex protein LldF
MNRKEEDIMRQFVENTASIAFNPQHRLTMNNNIGQYQTAHRQGLGQFANLEKARQLAKNFRWQAINKLDVYLLEFEEKFTKNGGTVIWAESVEDAQEAIRDIAKRHQVKTVVKSKSMVTEEIHLNKTLETLGVEVLETDLGEFVVQLEGSKPYHIVTPIMHKTAKEVAQIYHDKFDTEPDATPQEIAYFTRNFLREKFTEADLGVTGANFMIADTGAIVITENEGNARLSTSFPKTHVAIVGIEKMLAKLAQLDLMLPLLASYGTGQKITAYNTILRGPKIAGEHDGPENMYVILLDNGRTKLLADPILRESLYCIRCGACLNACPVYKNIGGHAYNSVYSGPIGTVIAPDLEGEKQFLHLSKASSLCGACTSACPVKIPLDKLIHHQRVKHTHQNTTLNEERVWAIWQRAMLSRSLLNLAPASMKNYMLQRFFKTSWGARRELPTIASSSFNKLWRQNKV